MKKILIFLLVVCSTLSFSKTAIGGDKNEEFNVTDMIMHHIKDSHEFHVLDWNGKAFSIPLPIVLWTDNPLSVYAQVQQTYVDGVCYFDQTKDLELRKRNEAERNRLIQKMLRQLD